MIGTGLIWFAERYLRYERAEQLYQQALTHVNDASARFFFRRAAELDEGQRPFPSPRYVRALAERQTGEDALETFAQARNHDAHNPWLAMRYGTVLYHNGHEDKAGGLFAEARAHAPDNALPFYLEAAALPWTGDEEDDAGNSAGRFAESLALIAQANASERRVSYPPPVWSDDWPRDGQWHAYRRRRIVEQTGMVLRQYVNHVLGAARQDIKEGEEEAQDWDRWLYTIEEMGGRLARAPQGGTRAVVQGLLIQRDSLRVHQAMAGSADEEAFIPDPDADSVRLAEVEEVLRFLYAFEEQWGAQAQRERQNRMYPLSLAAYTAAGLGLMMVVLQIVGRLSGTARQHWTINHGKGLPPVMVAANLLFLICLVLGASVPAWSAEPSTWFFALSGGWLVTILGVGGYGLYYPRTVLAPPKRLDTARSIEDEASTPETLAADHPGTALVRRYFGILFGTLLCAWCAWVLGYRLVAGLYPWEFRLMPSPLVRDEFILATEILQQFT